MNKATLAALLGTSQAQWMSHFKHANASNPFSGKTLFANPLFTSEVKTAESAYPKDASAMKNTEHIGAANWIDSMSKISSVEPILKAAKASGELPMFVIYDLPNRDCDALASNGEILCEDSTCAGGLTTYKTQYIDKIVEIFKRYPDVPVVAIIEPDSLPNLATNMSNPKCQQAEKAYKEGVSYTLKEVAALGHVTSYLDAAHGGWLGWANNLSKIAPIFKEVLSNAGGNGAIRGFVTNTANYQPLGSMNSTSDPCHLKSQYNFAIDEIHYIDMLDKALQKSGITGMGYITDTSRNGQTKERKDCANWCNIKGAGLGMRPTTNVSGLGLTNLDALVWIKTPGESDGTSNQSAKRHDQHCNSSDSFIPSPEAGQFSTAIYDMLVENARPPLTAGEMNNKITMDHVAQTPLGKQAQKYTDLWANQRDVGKHAFYQQTLAKQMESQKEDQWKIISEKNAQFMKSQETNKFKEANAHKQYLSKQAGWTAMQNAKKEHEAQEVQRLMKEHQDSMRKAREQAPVVDMQAEARKSKVSGQEQARTAYKAWAYTHAQEQSQPSHSTGDLNQAYDHAQEQANTTGDAYPVTDRYAGYKKWAKEHTTHTTGDAYPVTDRYAGYKQWAKEHTFWARGDEHQGFWSRDQYIANGPVPTPEMAAANKKYQADKAQKEATEAAKQKFAKMEIIRNDNSIQSDDKEVQAQINHDENRRRAMEYAKQQAYIQGKSATFQQHNQTWNQPEFQQ